MRLFRAAVCVAVALNCVFGAPTDSSSSQAPSERIEQRFVKFLAGDVEDVGMAVQAVKNISQSIKRRIADGEPLEMEEAESVLFDPKWQFLNPTKVQTSARILMKLSKKQTDGRKLLRVLEAGRQNRNFISNLELPDDFETLRDIALFMSVTDSDSKLELWSFNRKLVQFQSPGSFQMDLDNKDFLGQLLVSKDGSLTMDEWTEVPASYLRLWRQTLSDDVSNLMQTPFFQPLVAGASDTELIGWLQNWTEDKQALLVKFLPRTAPHLAPHQLQLLISPLVRGDSALASFRTEFLDRIDVSQLQGLTLADFKLSNSSDDVKMLALAVRADIDVDNLTNATDASAYRLFPALHIQDAIDNGRLVVSDAVFEAAKTSELSRGQASVLVSGYFDTLKRASTPTAAATVLRDFPTNLFFAMPFEFVMDLPEEQSKGVDWIANVVSFYDRLTPSQRLAMLWRQSKSLLDAEKDEESLLEAVEFGTNSTAFMNDVKQMDAALMRYVSPRIFKASVVARDRKTAIEKTEKYCADPDADFMEVVAQTADFNGALSRLNNAHDFFPMPLWIRRCLAGKMAKYLEAKSVLSDKLTPEEAYFGGLVWTGFSAEQRQDLGPDVQDDIVRGIGAYAQPVLIATSTDAELETMAKQFSDEKTALDFEQLSTLGSLTFYLGEDLDTVDPLHLRLFVSSVLTKKCACLPMVHAKAFAKALLKTYGEPEDWTMSDLMEMGDLVALFDGNVTSRINPESLRRATPFLIKNSCFNSKFERFPGFTTAPDFEAVCSSRWPQDTTRTPFKRALLQGTMDNVNIALTPAEDSPESRETTTQSAATLDRREYMEKVLLEIRNAYSSKRMTLAQTDQFSKLAGQQKFLYKEAVAEILGTDPQDIPDSVSKITAYLDTKRPELTGLQLDRIRDVMNEIGFSYVDNLVKMMKWDETDLGLDRRSFCRYASTCVEPRDDLGFNVRFDSSFDVQSFVSPAPRDGIVSNTSLCFSVAASGFAASSLTVEELNEWPDRQLYECLEVLGQINWPSATRVEVWKLLKSKIKDKIVTVEGVLQGGALLLLNNLVEAVATTAIELIDAEKPLNIEPLSILGMKPLKKEIVDKLALKFHQAKNLGDVKTFGTRRQLEVAAMGNLFCGLPLRTIEDLVSSPESKLDVFQVLGLTINACKNGNVLKLLAKKASDMKKSVSDWNAEDVSKYGVVVAGVDPTVMSKWPTENFRAFSPDVVSHLSPAHLASLSPVQLQAVPTDALAVLKGYQLPRNTKRLLTAGQIRAIESKHESVTTLKPLMAEYRARLNVLAREGSATDVTGKFLDFSNQDEAQREEQLYPNIDRVDTVVAEPSGASRPASTTMVTLAFYLFAILYISIIFCCLT